MGLFGQVGGVGTSILRERPTRLISAGASWQEPHDPQHLDKLWSFTGKLQFPLEHVLGATYDPDLRNEPKGWRGPGLGLPNKLSGTFHAGGNEQFWNISGYEKVVVFTLSPEEEYERVMVTVEDPHEVVRLVNGAIEPAQS